MFKAAQLKHVRGEKRLSSFSLFLFPSGLYRRYRNFADSGARRAVFAPRALRRLYCR